MSLNRSATFTCIKNGIKRVYVAYKGEEFLEYDLVLEEETSEENGVTINIQINDHYEKSKFIEKAKQKLLYYDDVVLIIDDIIWKNTIYRHDLFQFSSERTSGNMQLCLKDVVYNIDFDKLGIPSINCPIALRFGLSDGITPTPSREAIIFTGETISLIKNRIKDVANYMTDLYNINVIKFPHLVAAIHTIDDKSTSVIIEGVNINIESLSKYSDTDINKNIKIEGISIETPKYYRDLYTNMFNDYYVAGVRESKKLYVDGKKIRYNKIHNWLQNQYRYKTQKVILINEDLRGHKSTYLKEKYKDYSIFIKKNINSVYKLSDYKEILKLNNFKRNTWRDRIIEFQNVIKSCTDLFIDETNISTNPEFLQFVEKKKLEAKMFKNSSSNYISLNKKADDVTIAYLRDSHIGSSITPDKSVYNIDSLKNIKFLSVYFKPEDKEKAIEFERNVARKMKTGKVNTCLIGERDIKKIKNIHNFITMEQFEKSKPFKRLVTAIKIDKLINNYSIVENNKDINKYVTHLYNDVNELKDYRNKYLTRVPDNLHKIIMDAAEDYNMFDFSIIDVYNRVNDSLDLLDFVSMIEQPSYYSSDEEKSKYSRLVSQFILFKKLHYNKFEDYELVKKENPIDEIFKDEIEEEKIEELSF